MSTELNDDFLDALGCHTNQLVKECDGLEQPYNGIGVQIIDFIESRGFKISHPQENLTDSPGKSPVQQQKDVICTADLKFIEEYQCPGCARGSDKSCYVSENDMLECTKHAAGTTTPGIGSFFLGMPTGFNRLGSKDKLKINIFAKLTDGWGYSKFNVPVWKYLDEHGNTLVRGLCPRINNPFLHIFLENCIDKIDCLEITKDDMNVMD